MLGSVINKMVVDRFETEALVEQTLMKAYLNLPRFRSESIFRTWLISIGINEVGQYRRQRPRVLVIAKDIQTVLSAVPAAGSFADELEQRELLYLVCEAVAKLPRKYRIVVNFKLLGAQYCR